jgi:hypothetical protein
MERQRVADELRANSPLVRRMHRNTRTTLREYFRRGFLDKEPAIRRVEDVVFNYATKTHFYVNGERRSRLNC